METLVIAISFFMVGATLASVLVLMLTPLSCEDSVATTSVAMTSMSTTSTPTLDNILVLNTLQEENLPIRMSRKGHKVFYGRNLGHLLRKSLIDEHYDLKVKAITLPF